MTATSSIRRGKISATKWLLAGLMVGLPGALMLWIVREPLPSHNRRTVAQWFATFEDAGGYRNYAWSPGVQDAAREIVAGFGEDALPFLTRVAGKRPEFTATGTYARLVKSLPIQVAKRLPAPRADRRGSALWLIGAIGNPHLHRQWNCKGDSRRCNEIAVATLCKALRNASLRRVACETVNSMGPSAHGVAPELLLLLTDLHRN